MIDWFIAGATAFFIWLSLNGFHPSFLIGGFFGGIVRALISKAGTKSEKFLSGLSGAIIAGFAGPLLMSIDVLTAIPAHSLAFGCGLLGMFVVEGLINIAKDYRDNPGKFREDLRDFVLRIIGPKDK